MQRELLSLSNELSKRGEPFVIATVVRREPPSSARSGDTAIVTQSGTFYGWLGGSCTRPPVVAEARKAIQDGTPRLIALSPNPAADKRPGIIALPMTCHSGGSVDVYIEPVLPAPQLIVYGVSPIARALVRIGKVLGYEVEAVDRDADVTLFPDADFVTTDPSSSELARRAARAPHRLMIVVATLGIWDEEALQSALVLSPRYVGLVASKLRFGEMRTVLHERGVSSEQLATVRCPAGIDFGAVTPQEIALSILSEIVRTARAKQPPVEARAPTPTPEQPETGDIDPVCGMSVDLQTARYDAEYAGTTYLFCCSGCRDKFVAQPQRYVPSSKKTAAP